MFSWYKGLLTVATYALFLSDVFRSGFGIEFTNRPMIEPHIYSSDGPYNYEVATLPSDHLTNLTYYTTHPSALGLLAAISLLDQAPYAPSSPNDLFGYLDQVIHRLSTYGASPWNEREHVQMAARANANAYIDGYGLLGTLTDSNVSRTTWVTHYKEFNVSTELCKDSNDRPLFCEKTWAYCSWIQISTNTCDAENLWKAIEIKVQTLLKEYPTSFIDVTTIESESDPITYSGSGVLLTRSTYEVLTLIRVRNCDIHGTTCTTQMIKDYRYEGAIAVTDVEEWYSTVRLLRVIGQGYNILRFLGLLVGVYCASLAPTFSGRLDESLRILMRIPPQVVVYSGWIPLVSYNLALMIDSTMFHSITWTTISSASFVDLAQLISIHMRNVWLLAFLVRTAVFFRIGSNWNTRTELWGVKGHCYSLISLLSFLFIVKNRSTSSVLIASWEIEPSSSVALIHPNVFTAWNTKMSGLYEEAMSILVVLGLASGLSFFYWLGPRGCDGFQRGPHVPTMPLLYFAKTHSIPYSSGILWDATFLSVSWDSDLLLPFNTYNKPNEKDRHRLMNIVALTDPLNYFWLHLHANRIVLHKYRHPSTNETFWHPLPQHKINGIHLNTDHVTLVSTSLVKRLSWLEWVDCH
ncbi:hypothetical protein THRCLA_02218 [Thraustotheca clavata]|uniref:Transmembrane protein n=1 Tax=Thraustotheca clavata TaxID=74557 RepID=A0A1W0A6M9_9STRA|nr:hypothetical protein THRCLA_02218 [Thraustotheca clavata]